MDDMSVPSLPMPDDALAPAGIAHGPQQATPIDLDPETPALTGAPVEAIEPSQPAAKPGQPALVGEEELDELIIEDFTIDGICGVY